MNTMTQDLFGYGIDVFICSLMPCSSEMVDYIANCSIRQNKTKPLCFGGLLVVPLISTPTSFLISLLSSFTLSKWAISNPNHSFYFFALQSSTRIKSYSQLDTTPLIRTFFPRSVKPFK
jgi:hypothetical protein